MEIYTREIGATGLVVLDALDDAISDASKWPDFLRAIIESTGASSGLIVALSPSAKNRLWIRDGISDQANEQWHSYFKHIDPRFAATVLPQPGDYVVVKGEELVRDEELLQSEYYRDFAVPHNLRWMRGAWLRPNAPHASTYGLHLFRGVSEANFDESASEVLELVIRRMISHERIGVANALSRASGLGEDDTAVFLLNGHGALVMSNDRGAEMIETGAVIDRGRSLTFNNHNASAWLGALLSESGIDTKAYGAVARQRETLPSLGSVHFTLYPFEQIGSVLSLCTVEYALTLKPAESKAAPDLAKAAYQMYRWTGAELDTVRRLSAGDELPNIAQARDCSVETVRSHLKNAKRKAGVKRQVDLVRLMISLEG
ncbi:MAG: helix-turn-helix transcriptional regulator [Burkholderiaceae bacterium]